MTCPLLTENTELTQVEYAEAAGYSESWRRDGNQTVRMLDCDWEDRYDFVDAMMGFSLPLAGGLIHRHIPEVHPELPKQFVSEMELTNGLGSPAHQNAAGVIRYADRTGVTGITNPTKNGKARFRVTYTSPHWLILPDSGITNELGRYVWRRETFSAQNINQGGNSFMFNSPPVQTIFEGTPKIFPTKELSYTWLEVPKVPRASIDNCIGKVNSANFDSESLGGAGTYAPGSLLCLAPDVTPYYSAAGYLVFEITYKFLFRCNPNSAGTCLGHNSLYRRSTGFFEAVVKVVGAGSIYETADFNTLFQIP